MRGLRPDGDLYRIDLHLEGPDPRFALRERIATGRLSPRGEAVLNSEGPAGAGPSDDQP